VLNATVPPIVDNNPSVPAFISYEIDFDVKAPLCGLEMMRYANPASPANALYRLRLMNLDVLHFINGTNIGKSIEREMTAFTKDSIISLIEERKKQGSSWLNILALTGGIVGAILVAVAAIFGVRKYLRERNNGYSEMQ
jgi:hypothetical protein